MPDDHETRLRIIERMIEEHVQQHPRFIRLIELKVKDMNDAAIKHTDVVVSNAAKSTETLRKEVAELREVADVVRAQNAIQNDTMSHIQDSLDDVMSGLSSVKAGQDASDKERERRRLLDAERSVWEADRKQKDEEFRKEKREDSEDKRKDRELSLREKMLIIGLVTTVLTLVVTLIVGLRTGHIPEHHGTMPAVGEHSE